MYLTNNSNKIAVFTILYISLLVGFYFGENSSGGAYPDFMMRTGIIENFKNDFLKTFLLYDTSPDRHSPVILIIISYLNILGINLDIIRFIHLHLLPILIFISYKCLVIKFPNNDRNIIFLICCVFFLSPTLRSVAIWPDSRISGLVLFLFSIYFFLKFKKNNKFIDCILNNTLLVISSYLSPNFSIFFLYFLFFYIQYFKFSKRLMIMIISNILMSLPMMYYVFILDVNFLTTTAINDVNILIRLNPVNKILIIFSIILFYLIPFLSNQNLINNLLKNLRINDLIYSTIILSILFYFFNYSPEYTGGGIFFKLSYYLFQNPYLFFVVSFFSFIIIFNTFKLNLNNFFLLAILVISNPQLTIYHKYFDPLLIVLFFLFFDFKFSKEMFFNKKFLINMYIFYCGFLFLNFGKLYI